MSLLLSSNNAVAVGDKDSVLTLSSNISAANGSQNNTFIDSSVTNATVTRVGTPTQGSFSPYGDQWSNYFPDITSKLNIPTAANVNVGKVAGTIVTYEWWQFCTGIEVTTAYDSGIFGASPSIAVDGRWLIYLNGSSATSDQFVNYHWSNSPSTTSSVASTAPLVQNTWNHVAIVVDAVSLHILAQPEHPF